MQQRPDVCIAGAGIIGLALALELNYLGATVCVLERDTALSHASQAAAGMLAAHDPENPPQLLPLAQFSLAIYPAFLDRIAQLSGLSVPFQTTLTFQSYPTSPSSAPPLPQGLSSNGMSFIPLAEHSLDPRQLAPALLAAIRNTPIQLLENTSVRGVNSASPTSLHIQTAAGTITASQVVHTLGPWSVSPVTPRKGQMLAVRTPPGLDYVVRTPDIYVVPRTRGPHAGRAIIGATVEDAAFSNTTDPQSLSALRARAAALLPALADEAVCPQLDAWAGLRPHTPDGLPILGALPDSPTQSLATGHYRNGILLAPATAHVMAQLLAGKIPAVPLDSFSPARFAPAPEHRPQSPIFAQLP